MLFDVRAALAEILNDAPVCCDIRDSCDTAPVKSHESRKLQPSAIAVPAQPSTGATAPAATPPNREDCGNRNSNGTGLAPRLGAFPPSREAMPYRQSVTGSACTWTGRIVSLDEWRKLTEWDRHGSTGKMWNGLTGQWEDGGGA